MYNCNRKAVQKQQLCIYFVTILRWVLYSEWSSETEDSPRWATDWWWEQSAMLNHKQWQSLWRVGMLL